MTHKDRTTLDYLKPGAEERIRSRADFDFNDRDRDHQLTPEEFIRFMADLDPEMSKEECLIGFHEIDTNEDGVITLDEFRAWLDGA
ncbi:EF-hand domain-containing protein [Povalibacter sp.]|uniref:EF-hand domain-containing protein n=1 Tax=Povalibacter sp. TaxID=1962978 RepID=UPI002F407C0E